MGVVTYKSVVPSNICSRRRFRSPCAFVSYSLVITQVFHNAETKPFQRDKDKLKYWARNWCMRFHPEKCIIMQITRQRTTKLETSSTLEGTVLENVDHMKYLGVKSYII